MAQKRYGPTRAAGVVVIEKEGDKTIEPAALGLVGYAGVLERGPVGELIIALDKNTFEQVCGGRIPDSLLPDACFDYYNLANGAGGILVVRVTDGNEVQASIPVYTRHLPRVQLGTLRAHNGGRWGGKKAYYTAQVADEATDITAITIDTGVTSWTVDQWKGGYVELEGVPNVRYKITGNTAMGVITVDADSTMDDDLADGDDATNDRYYLVLENDAKELGVLWEDGQENPTTEFGLSVSLDGVIVKEYPNLSADPDSGRYWVNVINDDDSNYYVEAVDVYTGSIVPAARPANHYGTFSSITATVMTADIAEFAISSAGGGNPTFALGTTDDEMVEQTITLDMTAATTFNASSSLFGALGSGTLGVLFEPNNRWTPPFTVTAGTDPLTGSDTLTIVYKPFIADSLANGFLYPDKDNDRRLRYRIVSNDHNTITVASGSDMATDVTPIAGVAATGSITELGIADHVNGETFVLEDTEGVVVTFYYDVSGAYTPGGGYNATNVRMDISGETTPTEVAVVVRTAINAAAIAITASGAAANIVLTQDNTGAAGNNAILETVADVDYVVAGFTGGVTESTDEFQVEAYIPMGGGRDGVSELADTDYSTGPWSTTDSPYLQLQGKNLGLVKFATPGVTATVVQQAGVAFAQARNHQYRYEVPANITTDQGVDEYINDTLGRNDYAVVNFPSQGYIPDVDSTDGKLKLVSLTGLIHGREASVARTYDGYHKAQAGIEVTLPGVQKLPTGDRVLNEEFLNPLGINVIKKVKGNFVLWGDRTLWVDPAWKFKHQRELMSYYELVLQENFDFIVFAINDPETQDIALTTLNAFFLPEFVKRAIRGNKFTDAAKIKIDSENNTNATRAAGDMYADISLRLADTVERFIMRIGKQGIFESVA